MKNLKFLPLIVLCHLLIILTLPIKSHAQSFPNKSVKLVVGFPPGGMADIVARELGDRLSTVWKQAVIIENKPGASGTIAARLSGKSKSRWSYLVGHLHKSCGGSWYSAKITLRLL
jgi:tripartite-type tricarboxylate transporter receptor subunit TctC